MSQPKKVLIVDDEPGILMALEHLLQNAGFETEKARDGVEAIEKAQTFRPDIITLDVMMPRVDGLEVARTLRNDEEFAEVRIIFLSAKGKRDDRLAGYLSGGDSYLTKPFENQELVEMIKEMAEYG